VIFIRFHAQDSFLNAASFALNAIHEAARPDELRGEKAEAKKDGEPAWTGSDDHNRSDEQERETGNDAEGTANLVEGWLKHDGSTSPH
jgi:hypothetical protein